MPQATTNRSNWIYAGLTVAASCLFITTSCTSTTGEAASPSTATELLSTTTIFDESWIPVDVESGEVWIEPDVEAEPDDPGLAFAAQSGDTIVIRAKGCPLPLVQIYDDKTGDASILFDPQRFNIEPIRDLSIYVSPKLALGPARLFVRCQEDGDVSDQPAILSFLIVEHEGPPPQPDPAAVPRVCLTVDDERICDD